jgi:hypothetical protein
VWTSDTPSARSECGDLLTLKKWGGLGIVREAEAPGPLGATPEVRIAWNKLLDAVADVWNIPKRPLDFDAFHRFVGPAIP